MSPDCQSVVRALIVYLVCEKWFLYFLETSGLTRSEIPPSTSDYVDQTNTGIGCPVHRPPSAVSSSPLLYRCFSLSYVLDVVRPNFPKNNFCEKRSRIQQREGFWWSYEERPL